MNIYTLSREEIIEKYLQSEKEKDNLKREIDRVKKEKGAVQKVTHPTINFSSVSI